MKEFVFAISIISLLTILLFIDLVWMFIRSIKQADYNPNARHYCVRCNKLEEVCRCMDC